MKTLYVIRHAKSSWADMSLPDHDRPLLPAGMRKTQRIVGFLKSKKIKPDLMLSSTAVRALETAKLIAEGIGYSPDQIKTDSNMYHASSGTIFNELYGLSNDIESVMIFGHNPTFTYFVNKFIDPPIDNLPTSGFVGIEFDTNNWEEINEADYRVRFVVFPRMLK